MTRSAHHKTATKAQFRRQEAKDRLLSLLKTCPVMYTMTVRVAPSGQSRTMRVFIPTLDPLTGWPSIAEVTEWTARAAELSLTTDQTLRIYGGGMDMGLALVSDVASVLGIEIEQRRL